MRTDHVNNTPAFHNNLTTKEYIVQKKPCHLDHNWQSYLETFIFAKNDDEAMTCTKDRLNLCWGSDDPWRTSSFGGVGKRQ